MKPAPVSIRILAKFIDLFVVMFVSAVLIYPVGPLLGFLYSLFCDGIHYKGWEGQSVGKKILKLQAMAVEDGRVTRPVGWKRSVLRNLPVGVATFFAIIPIWGWVILLLVGVPLVILEIYLMQTAEQGRRLGDVMASTRVVERPTVGIVP